MSDWIEAIPRVAASASGAHADVEVGLFVSPSKNASLNIMLKASVLAKALASPHRFRVQFGGKAETKHMMRLVPDPDGPFQATPVRNPHDLKAPPARYRVRVPAPREAGLVKRPGQSAKYEIAGKVMTITLPPWCWMNPNGGRVAGAGGGGLGR